MYEWGIEQVSLHVCVCVRVHVHMQQAHMCGNTFFLYSGLLTTIQMIVIVK